LTLQQQLFGGHIKRDSCKVPHSFQLWTFIVLKMYLKTIWRISFCD